MADSIIFDNTYKLLSKSLDIQSRRQSLITGNIANMDTIGFKPKDLDFKETLKKAIHSKGKDPLNKTHAGHLSSRTGNINMAGSVRKDETDKYNLDSVNIDTEMTKLIENNMQYRTSVEMMLRKIGILRQAISEGGR